ncbi:MAG: radical SAM protein, partial [Candidatus Omnitrophota bacterium]
MNDLIILTTINFKKNLYAVTSDAFSAIPPNIQQGLLASYLKNKGFRVEIIEAEVDNILIDQLIAILKDKKPRLTGIICTGANPASSTMVMAGVNAFYKEFNAQKTNLKTFIWGPHPTVLSERTLRETDADFVIRGEGWHTIPALFSAISNGLPIDNIPGLSYLDPQGIYHQTPDPVLLTDLNILPPVDWEVMRPSRYRAHNWHAFGELSHRTPYAVVWTSFGCPFACNFCSINNLFLGKRTQRFRSIANVVDEITILREKHGVRHIKILDELFVVNEKRIDEFCDRLEAKQYDLNIWAYSRVDTINRRMLKRLKKIGMNWISYGFESSAATLLNDAKKGTTDTDVDRVIRDTQEEGLSICADVVFGLSEETAETMQQTYDFIVKYNFEWANIYPVFAYPGTSLFNQQRNPESWEEYSLYGYGCIPMG